MTSHLEVRHVPVTAVDEHTREITGLAVPWDTETAIGDSYTEKFKRGSVIDSDAAKLFWRHDEPIGVITRAQDTEQGWEITARIAPTARGDEAYTLLREGVIDKLSIGFQPIEHDVDQASGVVTRTKVRVHEVSLVPFPAYEGASVTKVRQQAANAESEVTMSDTTTADLTEVREAIEGLEREVKIIKSNTTPEPSEPTITFRSFGDYVKAVASGDEDAKRAYEGAVSGDTILKDAWIGSLVEILRRRQTVAATFTRGTLPAEGMGVEYAVLESDTTQVGVQADEGDDLLFGKVAIDTRRAPVVTLGGWSSLSRQAIERANVGILDTTFTALAEKYGRAVEVLARTQFNAALAATGANALAEIEADLTTQDGIVAAVLDVVEHFDDEGRSLDGVFVDKATFLALYGVSATDRVLQVNGAPADKVGTITVRTADASVAGLPFRLLPNAAAGTVVAYDSSAIKTLESPGAPLRLQDENIVNLTKDFSVYGYASSFLQVPAGLVKIVEG